MEITRAYVRVQDHAGRGAILTSPNAHQSNLMKWQNDCQIGAGCGLNSWSSGFKRMCVCRHEPTTAHTRTLAGWGAGMLYLPSA